jgi:Pro-kumamolisin, activation domain
MSFSRQKSVNLQSKLLLIAGFPQTILHESAETPVRSRFRTFSFLTLRFVHCYRLGPQAMGPSPLFNSQTPTSARAGQRKDSKHESSASTVSFVCALIATIAVARQSLLSRATDLGPVNPASPIEITLWLKLHDQQGLDALVAAQQEGKAGYLSSEQVRAQHAPSHAEAAKVADFLKAQGFTVTGIGRQPVRESQRLSGARAERV